MVGIEDPMAEIVASDVSMRPVVKLLRQVAPTEVNVLIRGESGTGKDLLANVLHRLSNRRHGPYVKIDCAGIPMHLLESELFGYEKGAFTDAGNGKPGRFELAEGGSLILDEISQLSLSAQAKLLTAIEEKKFQRLSGTKELSIDARLIVLTNVDLEAAVASKLFRSDLFYRLNVVTIILPPLRERKQDIARLARRLLKQLAERHGKKVRKLAPMALQVLTDYEFPGNIRELRNIIERAVIETNSEEIALELLPRQLWSRHSTRLAAKSTLAEVEQGYIEEVLWYTNGHKSRAAEILGIHRKTLLEKRKLYGIK
ncbi:MAG: sigma-54-dependent Fis family transcriptional regulator [Acidobacteria bacterium]|nr:sigma-54-dependent Fis family transcriptional regulator [Acidobacteriota bacterium]MBI3657140.1 sigma-54-dependent Fis family transcriptional regulator [Acidobacteriota bacterium]